MKSGLFTLCLCIECIFLFFQFKKRFLRFFRLENVLNSTLSLSTLQFFRSQIETANLAFLTVFRLCSNCVLPQTPMLESFNINIFCLPLNVKFHLIWLKFPSSFHEHFTQPGNPPGVTSKERFAFQLKAKIQPLSF